MPPGKPDGFVKPPTKTPLVAGAQGLEPQIAEPETAVLPITPCPNGPASIATPAPIPDRESVLGPLLHPSPLVLETNCAMKEPRLGVIGAEVPEPLELHSLPRTGRGKGRFALRGDHSDR
jgi:hypothetical protein